MARRLCIALVATLFCLPQVANAVVTLDSALIDFENLPGMGFAEGDNVSTLIVTDPSNGNSTIVTFSVFDSVGPLGTPILVQEGLDDTGSAHAFEPQDTPDGEVLGNGNDWFLGNGTGAPYNYRLEFSNPVENLSLDLYDFRADGPFSAGTPGSDAVFLNALDESGMAFPLAWTSAYTVPDPRPADGSIVSLEAPHSGIYSIELTFNPELVDAGTAIDNIAFNVVPEPSMAMFAWIIALAIAGRLRRKC